MSSGGLGLVYFYFSVAPLGAVSEPVPLIFTGSGSTSASGLDSGANAVFDTPGGVLYACSGVEGFCGAKPSSFSGTLTYDAIPNALYDIEVIANGGSSVGGFSATVDPMVEIDPTFADAADFALEFSANPTTTTIPEPPTWTLVILGLGMATFSRMRRRFSS